MNPATSEIIMESEVIRVNCAAAFILSASKLTPKKHRPLHIAIIGAYISTVLRRDFASSSFRFWPEYTPPDDTTGATGVFSPGILLSTDVVGMSLSEAAFPFDKAAVYSFGIPPLSNEAKRLFLNSLTAP